VNSLRATRPIRERRFVTALCTERGENRRRGRLRFLFRCRRGLHLIDLMTDIRPKRPRRLHRTSTSCRSTEFDCAVADRRAKKIAAPLVRTSDLAPSYGLRRLLWRAVRRLPARRASSAAYQKSFAHLVDDCRQPSPGRNCRCMYPATRADALQAEKNASLGTRLCPGPSTGSNPSRSRSLGSEAHIVIATIDRLVITCLRLVDMVAGYWEANDLPRRDK